MTHRPALDVISFQKLLNAAWVIQCQRDREQSALRSEPAPGLGSSTIEPLQVSVPPVSAEVVPELAEASSNSRPAPTAKPVDPVIPIPAGPLPPMTSLSMAAPASSPDKVDGSLALAPFRPWPPKKKGAIPFPATEVVKKPAWSAVLVSELNQGTALVLAKLKAKEAALPRLKVIIPSQTTRAARAYTGPVVVLLIVLFFVLFQMFSHRAGLTSVKASSEPPPATVQGSWDSLLESSHLRVTDPSASFVVDDLSHYEMRTVRRQAQFGDDNAALALGMAYEIGRQVPQSCSQAAQWITLSAEAGNAAAQYNLGLRYATGDGTPKDQEQAEKWLQTAARNGNHQAAAALDQIR
jgi:hypothetical protein